MAVLGVTDTLRPSFQHYNNWVHLVAPGLELVKLSYELENSSAIERCDGLLITGGGDVHPKYYGREDAIGLMDGVNPKRDEFEFEAIRKAMELRIPILGICRGMQVFNVATGGSMIPDVRAAGFENHRKDENQDRVHSVTVEKGTLLHSIVRDERGIVNTNHHQAVDRIGDGLKVAARSDDGLVEALEWEHHEAKPFLLLVQWHPERMADLASPFSQGILKEFVGEVVRSTKMNTVHD
ncbi:MAG: gamma-glutamyl-gamma-aminobutyrate hydrolase family protein [Bacteroidetes bacterium]|nr:gamma-glutamyl-gamma-aminobutyrate hydrolase family protein [Bacteroidota bacterium]